MRRKVNAGVARVWLVGIAGVLALVGAPRKSSANELPVADAGRPRYAATERLQLDGSRSYDPDRSGPLVYTWTQVTPATFFTGLIDDVRIYNRTVRP